MAGFWLMILFVPLLLGFIPALVAWGVTSTTAKAIWTVVAFFWVGGFSLLLWVLSDGTDSVDGMIGTFFAWCFAAFAVIMLLAWKPFGAKARRITMLSLAGFAVAVTVFFAAPEIYDDSIPQLSGEEVSLIRYLPFVATDTYPETLVKTLGEESTLKLSGDLPRLDGATALYPLYSAFVRAAYPERKYFPYGFLPEDPDGKEGAEELVSPVVCSSTSAAFENLTNGYADIVFLMGVSDEQRAAAEAKGVELALTPIGREAFVFFVNRRNSAGGLSEGDIKRIYSGEATDWGEVGGESGQEIRAYQRPAGSGSQTALEQLMGDVPIMEAPENIISTMGGLVTEVANYKNYKNALGYSFRYYVNEMVGEDKIKLLPINGVEATRENIAGGTYPFANDFYAVTALRDGEYLNAGRTGDIDRFLEWMLSPQGQYLVEATGYVAVG